MTVAVNEEPSYKEVIGDELVKKCLTSLLQQHQQHLQGPNSKGKKSVFSDALGKKMLIHLDIQSFKIPVEAPKQTNRPLHPKINRVLLPHTLSDSSSGVLLVTKDYPKPGNPTISNAHFQKMLVAADCNHLISEVMSLSQLKADLSESEARKELCNRIDFVFCDKAVVKVVPRLLGKFFLQAKKYPMAVKMGSENLKKTIERALSFTAHKMLFRNTQSALVVGHTSMPEQQLVDNLHCCLEYLCSDKFPGSWENVKTLYLTAGLKGRVPLYVSTASGDDVPKIVIKKAKADVFEGDFGFGNVKVTATGQILEYEPHPNDEEPIAKKILAKRQRRDRSVDSELSENKKRKISSSSSSSKVQAKKAGKITKKVKSSKAVAGEQKVKALKNFRKAASKHTVKGKSPKAADAKKKPKVTKKVAKAVIHTTLVETF